MALPLHEKDLNTMGASSLPERRLPQAGKPAQVRPTSQTLSWLPLHLSVMHQGR